MFTEQHYQIIIDIIREERKDWEDPHPINCDESNYALIAIDLIAERLADYFRIDNPKFKHGKFLKACNVKPDKEV